MTAKKFKKEKIPKAEDESWFWSKEWQESERRADEDLKAGRYTIHNSMEDLIQNLHSHTKSRQ